MNNKNQKKILGLILLILCFMVCILIYFYKSMVDANNAISAREDGNFSSMEELAEYYGCTFIKIDVSSNENFAEDIWIKFKCDLYEDEKSNEDFYNEIIEKIAIFLKYENFRLIDKSKEEKIEIEVTCLDSTIDKVVINGIEDYFIYMDSQIELKKYQDFSITNIEINSTELLECIQNNWNYKSNFGTRESIFQQYYIYYDEGIETRTLGTNIFNVVFTNKYQNPVISGLSVFSTNAQVKSVLGEPTFKNEDSSIIGYKSNDIYVFFEENQISIYRIDKDINYNEFFTLVDKFEDEVYSLKEFMNELTYAWPDYSDYQYDSNYIFISYPTKGIDIKIEYENTNGIVFYNNINSAKEKAASYLNSTDFVALFSLDNVFEYEKRRVENRNQFKEICNKFYEENEINNTNNEYDYYAKQDSEGNIMNMYFISKTDRPNCELNEAIKTYVWLNDFTFIYSREKDGIYSYNLQENRKNALITGSENFEINSIENGIVVYDNGKTLTIQ